MQVFSMDIIREVDGMSRYFYKCITCKYLHRGFECTRYPRWIVIKHPALHFCGEYEERGVEE